MIILSKQLLLKVTILNTNNLHTVIWPQVFQSNAYNYSQSNSTPLICGNCLLSIYIDITVTTQLLTFLMLDVGSTSF